MESFLLERDGQVQELAELVGTSTLVLLTGEAGIGKTSVLRELVRGIDPGVRMLRGACDDMLAPPPLQPIRDAVLGTGGPLERTLGQDDQTFVYDALIAEFSGAATLLIVEDVHWADDATLDLLRYLVRRVQRLQVTVVLTYRDDEVGPRHPLRALLGALTGVPVRRVELQPLSPDAVRSMAAAAGRDGDELYRLTLGNPFYLTEVLGGPPGDIPVTVVDATLARLHTLDSEALSLVEQLAVIPTPVDLSHVAPLIGDQLDAVLQAEHCGVLVSDQGELRFRHELARRAVDQSLPSLRRRELNARVVRLIMGCDVERELSALIHHASAAGDTDTLVRYAPRAARQATRAGSHRQALAHYEAVHPWVDRLDAADRAAVLAGYAWELHVAHRFPEAVTRCREAVELLESLNDPVLLTEVLLQQARHCYLAGETDAALAAVDRAFEVAQGHEEVLPAAMGCQGMMLVLTGAPAAALPVLAEAHVLATAAGQTDIAALCLNYQGVARCDLGEPGGLENLRRSIGAALATEDFEAVARGYTNLTEMLYRAGRWPELEETIAAGLEFTEERGFGSHTYNLQTHRGFLLMRRGDLAGAEQHLRWVLDTVDEPGMLSVFSTAGLGRVLARRGSAEAEELLAAAWEAARQQRSTQGLAYAATAYAEWAWLTGRPEVVDVIRDDLHDHALTEPAFRELVRYLDLMDTYAQGSCEAWEDGPYEQAIALTITGEREATLQALQIFLPLGAVPAARLAKRRLRDLGVRHIPRGRPSRKNPAGLTDRQLDVLSLLADGLTNAEIAAKLVLSVRTVDHHVSAILTRLGARTRREATTLARSRNLTAVSC